MNTPDSQPLNLAGITQLRESADLAAKTPGKAVLRAVLEADPDALPPAVRLARDALVRATWATAEADVRREDGHQ